MKKKILISLVFLFSILHIYCQNIYTIDSLKIQQLEGLCRIWGYLKYYHHEIQKGKIDWDTTLILYIPKILIDNNNEEYNEKINQLILLPGRVKKLDRPYKYLPQDTSYNNFDFSWINNENLFTKDNSRLLWEIIENYKPRKNIYLKRELNKYYDENGKDKYYYESDYYPDTAHALLAFFRYWNAINYFFAYKKITDENWNNILNQFIPKILESANSSKFYSTIAELITKINDCHGYYDNYNFNHEVGMLKSYIDWRSIPFIVKFIENKTVISDIDSFVAVKTNLKQGDIILSINRIPIDEIRNDLRKYCGCSHQLSVDREIDNGIFMSHFVPEGKDITITVSDSTNITKAVSFNLNNLSEKEQWMTGSAINNFTYSSEDSIGYINLSGIGTMKNFRKKYKNLKNSKALIFDIRNVDNVWLWYSVLLRLPKLHKKNVQLTNYYFRNWKYPGTYLLTKQKYMFLLGLPAFHKKYRGKVVLLIDENLQSAEEWTLMGMKALYKINLVGNNTSGTDGEAVSFLIQNNFLTYFTADAVFYPNGRPTQRVGIKPDIYAVPTIKGIREHRDEVSERALEFIRTGK